MNTFRFYDPAIRVDITHGNLPHWDQAGSTYFITWRTADSIPKAVWEKWQAQRMAWLSAHDIDPDTPDWRKSFEELPEEQRKDFRRFTKLLDDELDTCHGACVLRNPETAGELAASFHHFDGDRYLLGDYVIMPNHVHLLVGGMPRGQMLQQVTSWKKWSALQINRKLHLTGRFWQSESFDHLVRSEAAYQMFRRYIADNPGKAGLRSGEYCYWRRPA